MATSAKPKPAPPSTWERRELKRAEKQAAFDELVATGALIVRKMTADEQQKWAARRAAAESEPRRRRPPLRY